MEGNSRIGRNGRTGVLRLLCTGFPTKFYFYFSSSWCCRLYRPPPYHAYLVFSLSLFSIIGIERTYTRYIVFISIRRNRPHRSDLGPSLYTWANICWVLSYLNRCRHILSTPPFANSPALKGEIPFFLPNTRDLVLYLYPMVAVLWNIQIQMDDNDRGML